MREKIGFGVRFFVDYAHFNSENIYTRLKKISTFLRKKIEQQ